MARANTIIVKEYGGTIQEEALCVTAAILPGMLLEMDSDGKVKPHATAGGNQARMFAIEDELQGKGVEDSYAIGDLVQYRFFKPGDVIYAILEDDNEIDKGDFLESASNGRLQKHEADTPSDSPLTNQIVGMAEESLNLAGSSSVESSGIAERQLLKIRII